MRGLGGAKTRGPYPYVDKGTGLCDGPKAKLWKKGYGNLGDIQDIPVGLPAGQVPSIILYMYRRGSLLLCVAPSLVIEGVKER